MPKGPNSFFVPPDSEMIINGTIYSSDDPTGLYPTTCVGASANSGSMSSFVIGTPTSNTTYQLKIQDSGSNYTGTFIQRLSTASGADETLVWHGEPDRRHMWDIHNPLLKNYTTFFDYSPRFGEAVPTSGYYWESGLRNDNATNIRGVYFSVLDKEFIYVSRFDNNMPRLYVANRSVNNYETAWTGQGEITTLSQHGYTSLYNLSAIDSNKRGMHSPYFSTFSICEHSDGKLKLAVKYNEDIDIYESTDGTSFTLIAKMILSRFVGERFLRDVKIASSGPYLKIGFVSKVKKVGFFQSSTNFWLGGLVSSDGGATWTYTEIADSQEQGGAGIPVYKVNGSGSNHDFSYDLCGLSDGSGKFILATSVDLTELEYYDEIDNTWKKGDLSAIQSNLINYQGAYPGYIRFYTGSANSKFQLQRQMGVPNLLQSGKPFLASNNDWVWLVVAGSYNPIHCGWDRLEYTISGSNFPCGAYNSLQNGLEVGSQNLKLTRENAMFYMRIDADFDNEQWIPLGDTKVEPGKFDQGGLIPEDSYLRQKSGRTTGALGSYFYTPSGGNLYSCGPYMAFAAIGRARTSTKSTSNDNEDNRVAQYYRFSGWLIRPPYINLGLNSVYQNNLAMIEAFKHQEQAVLSVPEFNYIWGKPASMSKHGNLLSKSTLWSFKKAGNNLWSRLTDDGLHFIEGGSTSAAYQSHFYYFRCPSVCDLQTWTTGLGQAYVDVAQSDLRYPMFPIPLTATDSENSGESSWIQRLGQGYETAQKPPGCCIQFVFGGVANGSTARNSIGIKINSFTKSGGMPPTTSPIVGAMLYEFFLRMEQNTLKLINTSKAGGTTAQTYYREDNNVELCSLTVSGAADFSNSWWEGRISFLPDTDHLINKISVVVSVRQWGTETWTDSSIYSALAEDVGQKYASNTDFFKLLGIQGIAFGLFPDSASTVSRKVSFRSVKVCQGSDMTHLQMIMNNADSNFPPEMNLIRGRKLAPNPIYLGTGQKVSWGGIGGKFGDIFDTKIKSSYEAKNTIKVSSPRFEYRTKGSNTSDIKSSTAQIIYQLPDSVRSSNSLPGYGLFHSGLGIINTNSGTLQIEYSDTSDFSSSYDIGTTSLNLISGKVTAAANNKITVSFNGESTSRNSNDTSYTSTDSGTYYIKFTTDIGATGLLNKSYKVVKAFGNTLVLNVNDRDFSDGAYSTLADGTAGTSLDIYTDRCIVKYSSIPTSNQYMRITLTNHLGTTDHFKMGSMVAGITFGLQRVPINWEHSIEVNGNTTEFNSRSGVRWSYKEGPSVKTFTGTIQGDVYDDERENIKNIAEQATRFNSYPVAMVFDGDASKAFDSPGSGDPNAKIYIDPTNMLYGTINNSLSMVNEGWRYDTSNSEWKVVGDLQLTIIEVV